MQIDKYISEYRSLIDQGLNNVDSVKLDEIVDVIVSAHLSKSKVFVAGNGGSSAISEHLTCDHMKGVFHDTTLTPQFINLTSNVSLLTAIGNDIGYDRIFSEQLNYLADSGDVLIVISSSGNSPNIIKALETANTLGLTTIALTGFSGGQALRLADHNVHIPINNYGVCEDCHQIIMHILAQHIRLKYTTLDPRTLKL